MFTFLGALYLSAVHGLDLNVWILLGAFLLDGSAWKTLRRYLTDNPPGFLNIRTD